MSAAPLKDRAAAGLDAAMPTLQQLSHRLYHHPELGFEETRASAWLADELRALPGARVKDLRARRAGEEEVEQQPLAQLVPRPDEVGRRPPLVRLHGSRISRHRRPSTSSLARSR